MITTSLKSIDQRLQSYSAYVDFWDAEAGDTHEMLGNREVIHARVDELSPWQAGALRAVDDRVLALVESNKSVQGWDTVMLRKTASLIGAERASPQRRAA